MRASLSFLVITLLTMAIMGCNSIDKVAPDSDFGKIVPSSNSSEDNTGQVINVRSEDRGTSDGNSLDIGAAKRLVPAGK
ncbi:MAG: hypothetical protein ACI9G1_000167 [Pirellulaceae bacterium]|jgi:hypothetical protein